MTFASLRPKILRALSLVLMAVAFGAAIASLFGSADLLPVSVCLLVLALMFWWGSTLTPVKRSDEDEEWDRAIR